MKQSLFRARVIYIGVWCLIALTIVLFETNLLTEAFIASTPETEYALHLICIILTLAGTWGSLRLFKFVQTKIAPTSHSLECWNLVRTGIMTLCIAVNLLTYYGLMSGTTPLYCLFITLAGFVFCWPKYDEIEN